MPLVSLISKRLKDHYGAKEVILFGFYARGEAHEDSDIDLLVIADTRERFFERIAAVLKLLRGLIRYIPLSPIVLTPEEVEMQLKKTQSVYRGNFRNRTKNMTTNELLHPEDWKNIARKDWHRISVLLNDGDAEGAAIFVQQSYIKAFLLQNGWKLRKIHDLVSLLDSAVDFNPALDAFRDLCEVVTAYYFVERYPLFISSDLTEEDIKKDKAEASQMIKAMF